MNTEQLSELTNSIKKLPTKEDLNDVYTKLKDIFFQELSIRDQKIRDLEEKIVKLLENQKHTEEENCKAIDTLKSSIVKLESKSLERLPAGEKDTSSQEDEIDKEKIDLLVLGDSIVKHVDVEKIKPGGRNKCICIPGGTVHEIRNSLISESKKSEIGTLILNVGSNHVPYESPISISKQIISFCKEIRAVMPNTRLLFSGILPKLDDNLTPAINHANYRISRSSKENGYKVIIHKKFFLDDGSINYDLLSKNDFIHPNRHGVAVYGSTLKYFFYH